MSGTVTITITYPVPGTQRDMDAVKSVLIAADPYWTADYSSESTPGKVVLTIHAAGWPVVASVIAAARRTTSPGWSIGITSRPDRRNGTPFYVGKRGRLMVGDDTYPTTAGQ